jgi:steroid delta-isomerase-like uncharacterized protein
MSQSLAVTIKAANATLIVDGSLERVGEFFTHDYVAHATTRDLQGGHNVVRRVLKPLRRAFADLQVDVQILVNARDRIAWQRTLRGTHHRAFKGFPATGRTMVWRDMVTSRFEDGLIAEEWVITDLAERLLLARR